MISLTHVILVPKGTDDIRMIFNDTSSGLNDGLWGPQFALPALGNTLRSTCELW